MEKIYFKRALLSNGSIYLELDRSETVKFLNTNYICIYMYENNVKY